MQYYDLYAFCVVFDIKGCNIIVNRYMFIIYRYLAEVIINCHSIIFAEDYTLIRVCDK